MAKKTTSDIKESQNNDEMVKELQDAISKLKAKNHELEGKNQQLIMENQTLKNQEPVIKEIIKEVEKIVEVPVEKIVEKVIEKIVEVPVSVTFDSDVWDYKYKLGSKVYYPEKYQRLDFEVRELMGAYKGIPLYRIFNNSNLIEEHFVYEDKLFLL